MKSPIPLSYIAGAVIFGLVCAFGIAAMTHQPLPVQVQINQYAPIKPPAPAIPTVAPVSTPGKPFDPAPSPVIVTTQPLPTITPEPTPVGKCDVKSDDIATMQTCLIQETMGPMVNIAFGMLPVIMFLAAFPFIVGLMSQLFRPRQ